MEFSRGRVHGADVADNAQRLGIREADIVDFSSNVNIFLPDLDYEKIFRRTKEAISHYPDLSYRKLRQAVAGAYGQKEDQVVPGNGASELIYLINRLPMFSSVGIVNPTFCEYERAARSGKKRVLSFRFAEIDSIMEQGSSAELSFPDLLILCNPNNPTGLIRDAEKLLDLCRERGTHLLVDETFLDFQKNESFSLLGFLQEYPNLSVLKAVTKYQALTGVRLGYLFSSEKKLISQLWECKEPWSVNCLAEQTAIELFSDKNRELREDFRQRTQGYYSVESKRLHSLYSGLRTIKKVFEGRANYLLLKFEKGISGILLKDLLLQKKGFLVRTCTDFQGLDDRYLRIAIKHKAQNDALFSAISQYASEIFYES